MFRRLGRMLRALSLILAVLIILACAYSFLQMLADFQRYGGSALNGSVHDGHYYLANHGATTEVSRSIWEVVRADEARFWLSVPLTIVSVLYLGLGYVFPYFMGFRRGAAVADRVAAVRASGAPLASGRCGGSIAGVTVSPPLLFVEVYLAGVLIRVFPRRPAIILNAEVKRIEFKRGGRQVEITHNSPDTMSPIKLYRIYQSGIDLALRDMMGSER